MNASISWMITLHHDKHFLNFNVGKAADGSKTEEVAAAKPPEIQKLTKDTEVDPTTLMKTAAQCMKTMSVDGEKEKPENKVLQTLW